MDMLTRNDLKAIGELMDGKFAASEERMVGKITESEKRMTGKIEASEKRTAGKIAKSGKRVIGKIVLDVGEMISQQIFPRLDALETKIETLPTKVYIDDKIADLKDVFVMKKKPRPELSR